jgi:hypothetical protein
MKQFDANSIYQRLRARLRTNGDFSLVAEDSTINALLKTTADINSELARYMEYLLGEKKWDTAQNTSSIFSLCKMIGYKPHRKISAIGEVIVSHDPRLSNYLTKFFELNATSEQDATPGAITTNPSLTMQDNLRPWSPLMNNATGSVDTVPVWKINAGDIFKTSNGLSYIALDTKEIKRYSTAFSIADYTNPNFTWEGYKYVRVPVIQGEMKSTSITLALNTPVIDFLSMTIESSNIENAGTNISSQFFKVIVSTFTNESPEEWTKVDSIISSGPYDKNYEVSSSSDFTKVYVQFGDNKTGLKPAPGSIITVQYLSTAGSGGNLTTRSKISSLVSLVNADTGFNGIYGTGTAITTLYCTNDTSILGGKDVETIDEIKKYAPLDYLRSYTISTADSYETQIKSYISNVDKLIAFSGQYTNLTTNLTKDVVYLSATNTRGFPIKGDEAATFLLDSLELIGKKKSPTDTILYKDPEVVKLRINSKVTLSNKSVSETVTKANIYSQLFSKYSVFSQDFSTPVYLADINQTINSDPSVLHSNNSIEAVQQIDFTDLSKCSYNYSTRMFTFDFNFSKLFANTPSLTGFKTKKDGNVTFLLRVEVRWQEANHPNRTFFLYDTNDSLRELGTTIGLRIAQFQYIPDTIFDNTTMASKIIPPNLNKELFYYNVNAQGVEIGNSPITDKNTLFIGGQNAMISPFTRTAAYPSQAVSISFSENHDTSDTTYESGIISFPDRDPANPTGHYQPMFDFGGDSADPAALISYFNNLKNRVTIKVYAQPKITDILPYLDNTIIFVDDDDIIIESQGST